MSGGVGQALPSAICPGPRKNSTACDTLARAGSCGAAFTCRISTFSGKPEVELHIKDLWIGRYGDEGAEKEFG